MAFPRAPKKPITGSLKLTIKAPTVKGDLEPSPEELKGEDFSNQLEFSLPKGFSLDSSDASLLLRQQAIAMERLTSLREKLVKCGNCRGKVDSVQLDRAEELVEFCTQYLESRVKTKLVYTLGQEPDGAIYFDIEVGRKKVSTYVFKDYFDCGYYVDNKLTLANEIRVMSSQLIDGLNWLLEV